MPEQAHTRLVALALPPTAFGPALASAWERGDAVLPVDPGLPGPARDRLLATLRPAVLVTPQGRTALPNGVPVADGTALVVATSGSTGTPKGVELSHAALSAATRASLDRLDVAADQRWLSCLPTHHIGGLQVLLRAWALGTEPIVHDRFDPAAVAGETDAACVSLVPTMLHRLLDADVDLSRFAVVLLGGAAAPPPLLQRAAAADVPLVRTYGMTETGGGCVYDGLPLSGVAVTLDDDGGIRVRGAVLASGYRLRPDLTAARFTDGWLHTADLGQWSPEGRLEVLGRRDDVIVTGGEKVVPEQVARLLMEHPAVADAAVIGRPDAEWGQRVVAVVVPSDPGAPPTLQDLSERVRRSGPAHLAPKDLIIVDELPRLSSGKVNRAAVARAVNG